MIHEKRLMARMREVYKTAGYRVGNIMMNGTEWLIVSGSGWLVRMPAADVGRELKSQIVLHTGDLPGKPVMAQKDSGVQTMVEGELESTVKELLALPEAAECCHATPLTLRGKQVWQDENGRCCLFSGDLTGLVQEEEDEPVERWMGNRQMILDCGMGAAYILASVSWPEEQEQLKHLSGYDWTGGGEE